MQPGLALFASCSRHLPSEGLSNTSPAATLSSSRHPLCPHTSPHHTPRTIACRPPLISLHPARRAALVLPNGDPMPRLKLPSIRTAGAMSCSSLVPHLAFSFRPQPYPPGPRRLSLISFRVYPRPFPFHAPRNRSCPYTTRSDSHVGFTWLRGTDRGSSQTPQLVFRNLLLSSFGQRGQPLIPWPQVGCDIVLSVTLPRPPDLLEVNGQDQFFVNDANACTRNASVSRPTYQNPLHLGPGCFRWATDISSFHQVCMH